MPLSPTGQYTLPNGYLAVTGQDILPSNHNPPLEDIANVLSEAFYRTGVAPMLASLNLNNFKGINVANGTAAQDAVNKGQLDGLITYPTANSFRFGNILVQWLSQGIFLNAGGGESIIFATPYGNIPIVCVQNNAYSINASDCQIINVPTTAGFQIQSSPSTPGQLMGVNWIAIGTV